MKSNDLSKQLTRFEGIFCSGFFIPDQALVTALALLFEKVIFLNQLEYVIELSKRYRITIPEESSLPELSLVSVEKETLRPLKDETESDPIQELSETQKQTVRNYLYLSEQFFLRNARLFPEVFYCSLLPKGEVLSVELVKKGPPGQKNLYKVTRNPLVVCTGAEDELSRLVSEGRVPIVGGIAPASADGKDVSPLRIATELALKTVAMVLPGTKAAEEEDILEARDKLQDHLPSFWSSMLKLSAELRGRLDSRRDETTLQHEVDDAVLMTVRPALIDLVQKLEKDRKSWFHKILSPVSKGLRVLAGKPPTDLATLISTSMLACADVCLDVAQQLRKVEALKSETGLTYCIELHKLMSKPKGKK